MASTGDQLCLAGAYPDGQADDLGAWPALCAVRASQELRGPGAIRAAGRRPNTMAAARVLAVLALAPLLAAGRAAVPPNWH